ncbi:uncharacterized protein LOC106153291 [Lingula anatina]|uniref:Uncharacterized protein LOC106153291 n=1 Tax=Lingula anatina TaxID=7574 RepID=A0A1S3HBU1_LINAN|nr:uncharacterized protein LOC106153291 [Lingula anatina]|eukprot:XP_013382619.1 uncharacterized protein LOC106153291 [Lingula anatina]
MGGKYFAYVLVVCVAALGMAVPLPEEKLPVVEEIKKFCAEHEKNTPFMYACNRCWCGAPNEPPACTKKGCVKVDCGSHDPYKTWEADGEECSCQFLANKAGWEVFGPVCKKP